MLKIRFIFFFVFSVSAYAQTSIHDLEKQLENNLYFRAGTTLAFEQVLWSELAGTSLADTKRRSEIKRLLNKLDYAYVQLDKFEGFKRFKTQAAREAFWAEVGKNPPLLAANTFDKNPCPTLAVKVGSFGSSKSKRRRNVSGKSGS
jgi:hypothetical protein